MIMENHEEEIVETPELPTTVEGEEDLTDWKAEALKLKELALKNQGIAQRYKTKAEKLKESKPTEAPAKKPKTDEIDYGQEAYLVANGIKEADERELINERMKETGKSMKEVLENKFFQQDLSELRSEKATKAAIPSGDNRPGNTVRDTVDYWRAKIDSGKATAFDIPDIKLRREVVNARYKQEKGGMGNKFTDRPFGNVNFKP